MWFDGLSGSPGKSQKEGQEDQGTLKQLGGVPHSSLIPPWSSWPSFWLVPGLPDNPSNHLILQPVHKDPGFPRDPIGTLRAAGCKIRWFDGLSGSPGKSQKERQEDQGTLKQLGRDPPASCIPPCSSWPSFWLFPELPDNPSSHLILKPVQRDPGFPRDPIGTIRAL